MVPLGVNCLKLYSYRNHETASQLLFYLKGNLSFLTPYGYIISRLNPSRKDFFRQGVLNHILDGPLQGTRPHFQVGMLLNDIILGRRRNGQRNIQLLLASIGQIL